MTGSIMEEDIKGIQDYIQILKRNKNQMIMTTSVIFLIVIIVAVKLPAVYKSTATILIEQQEIPQELVRSTVTSYADQRIQVISQRVMSSTNLTAVIDKFNLFEDDRKVETSTAVLEKMREDIQLEMVSADVIDPQSGRPTQATIAFTLSFNSQFPKVAQQVTNELVSLYLNENLKRRTEAATETTDFLAIEAEKLSDRISEVEMELAEFKETNSASLPELQPLNMQLMARVEQQIIDVDRQINSLKERALYLNAELVQINPHSSTFSSTGERIFGAADRLKSLQAEYVALTARYASTHPDIIKIQREMSALEKEVGGIDKTEIRTQLESKRAELASLSERYSSSHPDVRKLQQAIGNLDAELMKPDTYEPVITVKADNPAFIQLQTQLQAVNAELRAMNTSKSRLLAKLEAYEAGLLNAPQVERRYKDLMRDYENATAKYREVRAKQMGADMAQAMEKDRKGERFTLIEPPLFPEKPFKPNREAIVFLGLVLAVGAAFGLALLKASLDQGVYGVRQLTAITGASPLIVVPYIQSDEDLLNKKKFKQRVVSGILAAIILGIILFHVFIMPLDVLWYVVLRKLGLNEV